jgi:Fe2+-dicitrate sensor, membrane component
MLAADVHTAPGEIRALTLSDGSRVELGPSGALAERSDDRTRRVELLAGRAYFAPLPMAAAGGRPFVVEAAGAPPPRWAPNSWWTGAATP